MPHLCWCHLFWNKQYKSRNKWSNCMLLCSESGKHLKAMIGIHWPFPMPCSRGGNPYSHNGFQNSIWLQKANWLRPKGDVIQSAMCVRYPPCSLSKNKIQWSYEAYLQSKWGWRGGGWISPLWWSTWEKCCFACMKFDFVFDCVPLDSNVKLFLQTFASGLIDKMEWLHTTSAWTSLFTNRLSGTISSPKGVCESSTMFRSM